MRGGVQSRARGINRFVILASWLVILAAGIFVTLVILTKLH